MWKVLIEDEAAEIFGSNQLTKDDRIVIKKWAETVREHGPKVLEKQPSVWADHALFGEWTGYRASSFSYSGRIIYRIDDQVVTVIVVRISPNHDYKRRK